MSSLFPQPRSHQVLVAVIALLFGCGPKTYEVKKLPSPVEQHQREQLPPEVVREAMQPDEDEAYKVGPGDTLLVAVYGHPELSLAQYAGERIGGRPVGLVVDNDGTIQLPLIGSVQVAGRTTEEMRVMLERTLAKYLKDPRVTVQILFNGSIRYYLLGQFTDPGLKFADRPMRLLEALSLGGSVVTERASLGGAYVARGNKRLPVNFASLLRDGDLSQNIPLRTGDVVFVPDNASDRAYVFGGSPQSNPEGGAVPFVDGNLTLLQALAAAGFGIRERSQTRLSKTVIVRSKGASGELFVVNARRILDGEAAPFMLEPGDVVFVPLRGFTSFNEALSQLIPTLQAASGMLQPFVQIRFLQRN